MYSLKKSFVTSLLFAALMVVPFGVSNITAAESEVKIQKAASLRSWWHRQYGYRRYNHPRRHHTTVRGGI